MGKKDAKKPPVNPLERMAKQPPQFTVLSDLPLTNEEYATDAFDLAYRMGPVFDVLRHPNTKTPLAVAVFGAWGSGKTSAMRCLQGMLNTWTNEGKASNEQEKVKVHCIWFDPWKYHEKEDVWRGLIAEVILASIDVRNATPHRVLNAAKQFGRFLGRSFLHVLTMVPGVDTKVLDKVRQEYREAVHPEEAFLNKFEESLEGWIENTLGKDERMVIFIDDLDRCMPDVALKVLEALKLYLNMPRLVFVVGVDRGVVEDLVKTHYAELGLSEERRAQYLAKMFPVEVTVGPSDQQIEAFLDKQLAVARFGDQPLSEDEQAIY